MDPHKALQIQYPRIWIRNQKLLIHNIYRNDDLKKKQSNWLQRNLPHLAINILELIDAVGEGDHLRWADEGKVQGIEVDDHVLPLVIGEGDLFELSVHDGLRSEGGGGFLHLGRPGWGAHAQVPRLRLEWCVKMEHPLVARCLPERTVTLQIVPNS